MTLAARADAELAIDVRGLTKRYGGRAVVDDVSLQVRRGQLCAFLGPNGSGKTTTIRLLCGLLKADAGQGSCLGLDIATRAEFTPPVIYSNSQRSRLVFMVEARPEPADAARLRPGQPLDVSLDVRRATP